MKNLIIGLFALTLCGCTTGVFYRSVQGNERIVGVSLPNSSSINISAYQSFEGEKVTVRDPAVIRHIYQTYSIGHYFGCVSTTNSVYQDIWVNCNTNSFSRREQ